MRKVLLSSVLVLLAFGAGTRLSASDLFLVHAKVYPSPTEAAIDDATIVIHDGRIAEIGPSSTIKVPKRKGRTVIDCTGMTVTAGFWNSHVHILTDNLLDARDRTSTDLTATMDQMFNRWGFTTVFDIASVLDNTNTLRRRIDAGEVRGPRILTVGEPFYPAGGTPIYIRSFLEKHHIPSAEVKSGADGVARVDRQVANGADGIKIFAGAIEPGEVVIMPLDVASAIVSEAHRHGKPVFAHPSNDKGLEVSIESGVDILAHTTPMSGPWSAQMVQRIRDVKMALIPTLTLFEVEAKKFGESPEDAANDMRAASQQLKAFSDAGGQVLFGTDVGYTDYFDTSEEFRLMSAAGLSFPQILASLTTAPAARFGYSSKCGRVAKGLDGDLVVLAADPARDVTALSRIVFTIRGGKVIFEKKPS